MKQDTETEIRRGVSTSSRKEGGIGKNSRAIKRMEEKRPFWDGERGPNKLGKGN